MRPLRSSVSEVRAKSAEVGAGPGFIRPQGLALSHHMRLSLSQIAYLMSAVTNPTNQNLNKNGGYNGFKSNGNGKHLSTTFKEQMVVKEYEMLEMWRIRT